MKKIVICLGIFAMLLLVTSNVYAYNQVTGWQKGPEAIAGQKTSGKMFYLTSKSAPLKGSESYVFFDKLGYLREGVAKPITGREIIIYLMEDDADPNADDFVKRYIGTFKGLDLDTIKLDEEYTAGLGNIDSANDATGELYITAALDKITGDKTTTNGAVFDYEIRVD